MRYHFGCRIVVEPIRVQRMEAEARAEAGFSFGHHAYPMREMHDELQMRVEVESPRGLTDTQQKAFGNALNRMARTLRRFIAEEFEAIEEAEARKTVTPLSSD